MTSTARVAQAWRVLLEGVREVRSTLDGEGGILPGLRLTVAEDDSGRLGRPVAEKDVAGGLGNGVCANER